MASRNRNLVPEPPFPPAVLWYGMTALLLLFYATFWLASVLKNAAVIFSPAGRIVLLFATCLCAFLGARLPRRGEVFDRAVLARRVRRAMLFCFWIYLHLLLTITLFDRAMGRDILYIFRATAEDRAYYMRWHTNFVPFHSIRTVYIGGWRSGLISFRNMVFNLMGNAMIFMPFGFFLPYLWPRLGRSYRFIPIALLSVIAVECCQLALMCGAFDIDDILLNFGGALVTYGLLRLPPFRRCLKWLLGG